ncbi:hypothetical protein DL93DRAFT_2045234, partial [Clavulina sp. PMI_390]
CAECSRSLNPKAQKPPALPKHALANKLYLGSLPDQFRDLTWVEEQACALMRSTHYVFRLYHSSNPQDPYQARGNSCAYPQNIVSVAEVLPRTPADVAGSLGVVFTGPSRKLPSGALQSIFKVRKSVLCNFLEWLRLNNPLYRNIEISQDNLAMYNDNEDEAILPGIEDRVITNE